MGPRLVSEKASPTLTARFRVSKKFLPVPCVCSREISSDNSSSSPARERLQLLRSPPAQRRRYRFSSSCLFLPVEVLGWPPAGGRPPAGGARPFLPSRRATVGSYQNRPASISRPLP